MYIFNFVSPKSYIIFRIFFFVFYVKSAEKTGNTCMSFTLKRSNNMSTKKLKPESRTKNNDPFHETHTFNSRLSGIRCRTPACDI